VVAKSANQRAQEKGYKNEYQYKVARAQGKGYKNLVHERNVQAQNRGFTNYYELRQRQTDPYRGPVEPAKPVRGKSNFIGSDVHYEMFLEHNGYDENDPQTNAEWRDLVRNARRSPTYKKAHGPLALYLEAIGARAEGADYDVGATPKNE
jgi:hypothetical protein